MNLDIPRIAKRLREVLEVTAPGLIEKAILFGSRVYGTATPDSDLDILVVLKGECPWQLKNAIYDACYQLDLEFDVVTDVKVYGLDQLSNADGTQPFIISAFEHGVAA